MSKTQTSASTGTKKQTLAKANVAKTALKVVSAQKESKYTYPKECVTALEKKMFRRKCRIQKGKYLAQMEELKAKTDKASKAALGTLKTEVTAWEKKTYRETPVNA